ncbi:amidase [Stappia sp. F7233]|uniref:Indoleacetamide hydrolase n=1 Tax=Stappia albiluteola TaxID=2758565 RepID=A0A839AHA3_9HYPH|nr:amidase [Stappia albiluteola]MBA5778515.1 amidase [Stappia albiluteola]
MTINRPNVDQIVEIARELGMSMSAEKAAEYLAVMQANFDPYDMVDAMADNLPPVKYPRTPGYRPGPDENPLNAWYFKSEIKGAPSGKLAGKRVVIKDNVAVAGVPMMNGSSTLEGFVPSYDATIVSRLLDAGATVVGKSTCEQFCLSAGSHSSDPGPVHNPHKYGYSAGGSSSGSAALVAKGEVELAIGGDQGGSIRIPAAFCGVYGMKATYGLVPYTGVMPIEMTVDHTGPITNNVLDNALMLEVLAGPDGLDPRQYAPKVTPYADVLDRGVKGMRIGLLKEGLEVPLLEDDVAAKVRAAADHFASLGAIVEEVSIPEHPQLAALWGPIGMEGLAVQMMFGNGMGYNWKGFYDVALMEAHSGWRDRADDLSKTLTIAMIVGRYMQKQYRGAFYGKAQNIARRMKAIYDAAFAKYDLILTPTVGMKATRLPGPDAPIAEIVSRSWEMLGATAQYDVTGHPAMSIPCGMGDGLPIGLSIAAADYQESKIYQAAAAFEASVDWRHF